MPTDPHFDGATYNRSQDHHRLAPQLTRVRELMADGQWRTLDEIGERVNAPGASVSARLRDLRKPRNGGYTVDRRARGERSAGLFEYRVTEPVSWDAERGVLFGEAM